MKIDKNIVVKCKNLKEVKDCLNKLKELGLEVKKMNEYNSCLIVSSTVPCRLYFSNYETPVIDINKNIASYDYFLKLYKKQKSKQHDLVVNKNGKILQKDYLKDYKNNIFYFNTEKNIVDEVSASSLFVDERFDNIDFYTSEKACKKALKHKEIENKLRALAFDLNGSRDITEEEWKDYDIKKYFLLVNCVCMDIRQSYEDIVMYHGSIFCLSEKFVDKAIELIGEEDLKDYLINC